MKLLAPVVQRLWFEQADRPDCNYYLSTDEDINCDKHEKKNSLYFSGFMCRGLGDIAEHLRHMERCNVRCHQGVRL